MGAQQPMTIQPSRGRHDRPRVVPARQPDDPGPVGQDEFDMREGLVTAALVGGGIGLVLALVAVALGVIGFAAVGTLALLAVL